MGIRIKKYRNGEGYRPHWYASYRGDGKVKEIRLSSRIEGHPPKSLSASDEGDLEFERSKVAAQKEFDGFLAEIRRKDASTHILEKIIEEKTGREIVYHKLTDLPRLWLGINRIRKMSEERARHCQFIFNEFTSFCGRRYLYQVTDDDVNRYLESCRKTLSWSSVKSRMSLLAGAFDRFLPHGLPNPFKSIVKRDTSEEAATIHRLPLSEEEIRKLGEHARKDPMLHYLFECALATGARIGDVCKMKWENVDLNEGFITYRSSKTGAYCCVPIFDELRAVLDGLILTRDPEDQYLCPDAALMYETNKSGVVYRGKRLFAEALFTDEGEERPTDIEEGGENKPKTPQEVFAAIDEQCFTEGKTIRIKEVYDRYIVKGQSYRQITRDTGFSGGILNGYLHELEHILGKRLRRFDPDKFPHKVTFSKTRQVRAKGMRAVSVYGWHSLRATFCVHAMLCGIPETEIIKAVGHSTYKTTTTYYTNPTRKIMKEMWRKKMSTTAIGEQHTAPAQTLPASTHPTVEEFVAKLTPEERKAITLELLRTSA
ncbi:MAG: tyrosine-type recombinase/integrase [Kiritimatiellae bacterium]|nr:tyrosine-type recombinase/integrase [Kiritimatiellia bacterium]